MTMDQTQTGDGSDESRGPAPRRRTTRVVVFGLIGLVVVLAIGGVVLYLLASRTSSASTDTALEDFRASQAEERTGVPGLPEQGVYLYSVTGRETIGGGPLSVSRSLPATSPRILIQTDDGYEIEWRISSDHTESWGYRLDDEGASATFERSTLSVAGIEGTTESEWSPPPLRLPRNPKVGQSWTAEAQDGGQRIQISSEVTGEETIDVAGTPVDVFVIESTLDYSGDVEGQITETNYHDPKTGMEIRHVSDAELDDGTSKVTTRWDARLQSMEPAT